jgi:hypothetical protein
MAGTLVVYSLIFVTLNNAILTQEGSCSMKLTTGSQAVGTVPLGYAGESPGMNMCEIDIESAVPLAAVEYDPGTVMQGLIVVEIGIVMAGKVAKSKGTIIEADYKHALNSESKQSLRFRGSFPQFE